MDDLYDFDFTDLELGMLSDADPSISENEIDANREVMYYDEVD